MKKYFSILFLALSFLASATPTFLFTVAHDITVTPTTVKPNTFPDGGIPNLTEAIYSQESGQSRKYTLANTQKAIGLKAATSTIAYVPTATGNPISDRNKIVKCSVNSKTYLIDILGNAIETGASAVSVVPQNFATNDLTFTGTRSHNASGFGLTINNLGKADFIGNNAVGSSGGLISFEKTYFGYGKETTLNATEKIKIQTPSVFTADPTGKFLKCVDANGQVEYANIPTAAPTTVSNTFGASGLTTTVNGVNSTPISVVSTDANNAIVQGTDNKMFVAVVASQNIMNSSNTANGSYSQDFAEFDMNLENANVQNISANVQNISANGIFLQANSEFNINTGIELRINGGAVSNNLDPTGKFLKCVDANGKAIWENIPTVTPTTQTATQTPFTAITASATQTAVTGANVQAALSSVATSLKTLENTTAPFAKGDTKLSYVSADHNGWILLNGRAISTLTATQQTAAAAFFSGNIDNTNGLFLKSGANGTSGSNTSSVTLTSSNIPQLIIGGSATVNTIAYVNGVLGNQGALSGNGISQSGTASTQSWNVNTTGLFVGNPNAQAVIFPVNPQSKNLNHFIYLGL